MRSWKIAAATMVALATTAAPLAQAAPEKDHSGGAGQNPYSFAVIGDVPYGADQLSALPTWISEINAADPRFTVHVGDIKNGSTRCDDAYYRVIKADFDQFAGPLVYTPGDNEWTDCHRVNNGSYNPLERLAFDRSVFFAKGGTTLGQHPMKVSTQARHGLPENVSWRRHGVDFAALHVVGSNNDLQPWAGIGNTAPTAAQVAEQQARMTNVIRLVKETFAHARRNHDRAVALFLQADMFDPTFEVTWADDSAFTPLVQTLINESNRFRGDVYLFNGDSHLYNADRPLAPGSKWLSFYGVTGSTDRLQRITVDGSSNNKDWLKVTINSPGAPETLQWERLPYQHQA
jgi:hypothetical protein